MKAVLPLANKFVSAFIKSVQRGPGHDLLNQVRLSEVQSPYTLYIQLIFSQNSLETLHIDSLVQECSISIATALEILQSCTKPSIYVSAGYGFDKWSESYYSSDTNYAVNFLTWKPVVPRCVSESTPRLIKPHICVMYSWHKSVKVSNKDSGETANAKCI